MRGVTSIYSGGGGSRAHALEAPPVRRVEGRVGAAGRTEGRGGGDGTCTVLAAVPSPALTLALAAAVGEGRDGGQRRGRGGGLGGPAPILPPLPVPAPASILRPCRQALLLLLQPAPLGLSVLEID